MQDDPTTEQLHTIYGLVDPRTETVRYVGVTKRTVKHRLRGHLSHAASGKNFPVCRWIRKLKTAGLAPFPIAIEITTDREREVFWVSFYRQQGFTLLNCNAGGGGNVDAQPETREKMRQAQLGKKLSPEHIEKIRRANTGRVMLRESIEKARRARIGAKRTPEMCKRIGDGTRGKKHAKPRSQEHRDKISARWKGVKRYSETDKALMSMMRKGKPMPPRSTEHKAKLSKTAKHAYENSTAEQRQRFRDAQREATCTLSEEDVKQIRQLYATQKISHQKLGEMFGVKRQAIGKIINRERWKHVE